MLHHPENITNLDRQGTYRESVFADKRRVTAGSTIEDDRVAMQTLHLSGTLRLAPPVPNDETTPLLTRVSRHHGLHMTINTSQAHMPPAKRESL